ncbi:MAG TPA: 5-(carboxyamino)imidazole ribonucleotide synthase [Phycisphaerae bacterium]|nr:5-(carboxyamino)imidazole ribonucleotide synthase [Phycisphaerae bacterium]
MLQTILAPATIGILGGGQLGAMLCEAARRMGYTTHVLSESPNDPAARWADRHITGNNADPATVADFARDLDVLTNEFEQVPPEVLQAAESLGTVRVAPSSAVQSVCRDRRHEKSLFATHHFPHGPFAIVNTESELLPAYKQLSTQSSALVPVVAKTARGGYDGKGQLWLRSDADAARAWSDLGAVPLLLEQAVPFIAEASVIVARNPSGQSATFPMFKNEHRHGILHQTLIPAGFPAATEKAARAHAAAIAEKLGVVGLLAVEMFVLDNGDVRMNELAARPHNSGHVTLRATARSQFELHIAAICNLPLGPTAPPSVTEVPLLQPAVMTNLLGDLWRPNPDAPTGPTEPHWQSLFADPRATLHLYGKSPRPGRKMGHMIHTAPTPTEALAAATTLFNKLSQ